MRLLGNSAGLDPLSLLATRDLVLHAPPRQAAVLARGVLLDDWLDPKTRAAIDTRAIETQGRWTEAYGKALTVAGADLAWIHQGELFADVFLREERILAGVAAAFADATPKTVLLDRIDPAGAAALAETLSALDIAVVSGAPAPAPRYPIAFATSVATRLPLAARIRHAAGIPRRVRGPVLVKPYRNLTPLLEQMIAVGPAPTLDPVDLPPLAPLTLAQTALRGGWIGHGGWRARRRSRAAVGRALEELLPNPDESAAQQLLTVRAHSFLSQVGQQTPSAVESLTAAFAKGGLRAAVMPSDGSPAGRTIVAAARLAGARTVHVQHGFFSDLWRDAAGRLPPFIDGLAADRAAVWSDLQAELISPAANGTVEVTGNPGAVGLVVAPPLSVSRSGSRRAVVLVQPPVGSSAAVDIRAPIVHAELAIAALTTAGFSEAILRPHPLDPGGYEDRLAARAAIDVRVVRGGPIDPVLAAADACIGCLSTATLEAAALGLPTVFLETLGRTAPWPLDRSGVFPHATSPEAAAAALLAGTPTRDIPLAALGARPDAIERVLDLLPN